MRPSSVRSSSSAIVAVQPISLRPSSESQITPNSQAESRHSLIIVL